MANGKSTKRKNKPVLSTGLFLICLTLPLASQGQDNYKTPSLLQLLPGDLILRRGKGIMSDIAADFSPHDKRFSHVGILHFNNGQARVTHSIHEDEKGFDGVVDESLEQFVSDATNWSVYRLNLSHAQGKQFAMAALNYSGKGIRFDSKFDLSNSDELYCTEFIWRALADIGKPDLIRPDTKRIGNLYISVEDTYNHANARLIDSMKTDQRTVKLQQQTP